MNKNNLIKYLGIVIFIILSIFVLINKNLAFIHNDITQLVGLISIFLSWVYFLIFFSRNRIIFIVLCTTTFIPLSFTFSSYIFTMIFILGITVFSFAMSIFREIFKEDFNNKLAKTIQITLMSIFYLVISTLLLIAEEENIEPFILIFYILFLLILYSFFRYNSTSFKNYFKRTIGYFMLLILPITFFSSLYLDSRNSWFTKNSNLEIIFSTIAITILFLIISMLIALIIQIIYILIKKILKKSKKTKKIVLSKEELKILDNSFLKRIRYFYLKPSIFFAYLLKKDPKIYIKKLLSYIIIYLVLLVGLSILLFFNFFGLVFSAAMSFVFVTPILIFPIFLFITFRLLGSPRNVLSNYQFYLTFGLYILPLAIIYTLLQFLMLPTIFLIGVSKFFILLFIIILFLIIGTYIYLLALNIIGLSIFNNCSKLRAFFGLILTSLAIGILYIVLFVLGGFYIYDVI